MRLHYTISSGNTRCRCESVVIQVGRDSASEICLDDECVSRHHAIIREEMGHFVVEDRKSGNGTFVNGVRIIRATVIREGDRISFGNPGPEIRIDQLVASHPAAPAPPPSKPVPPAVPLPPPFVPSGSFVEHGSRDSGVAVTEKAQARSAATIDGSGDGKMSGGRTRLRGIATGAVIALAIGLLLAGIAWRSYTISLPNLFQRVAPATAKVYVVRHNGEQGSGSGFFVDQRGWLVTNFHVAVGASRMDVELNDGTRLPVTGYVASAPAEDLVILKVDTPDTGVGCLKIAASSDELPPVGTEAYVVGHPLGLKKSLTVGTVTAHITGQELRRIRRQQGQEVAELAFMQDNVTWLQTDAATSHGNSGGPLLNRGGEIIGIIQGGFEGGEAMNLAIAVKHLRRLMADSPGQVRPLAELPLGESE